MKTRNMAVALFIVLGMLFYAIVVVRPSDVEAYSVLKAVPEPKTGNDSTVTLELTLPVALELLNLPAKTSSEEFIRILSQRMEGAASPREEALRVLHASPLTPDYLLKLRLKEVALAADLAEALDPRYGSHLNPLAFQMLSAHDYYRGYSTLWRSK